jgi:GxxExxY protein
MRPNAISGEVIDAAYSVHVGLGPGLLESVYRVVLAKELESRGLHVVQEQKVPVEYKGLTFDMGFRVDLIVERVVIVEIKSVETLAPVHAKQLLTYLRLTRLPLGLLLNFNVALIKDGIVRIVNGLRE